MTDISRNRPKIYIAEDMYIYRSDYNCAKFAIEQSRLRQRRTDEDYSDDEIYAMCQKHSHTFRGARRGDIIVLKTKKFPFSCHGLFRCILLRADYGYNGIEQSIIVIGLSETNPFVQGYIYTIPADEIEGVFEDGYKEQSR